MGIVCTHVYAQSQLSPEITSWITTGNNSANFDAQFSILEQVQYTDEHVFLSCSGIPTYDVGPWDDPALGTNQNFVFSITRTPQPAGNPESLQQGRIGVWSNGISVYSPINKASYQFKDTWHFDEVSKIEEETPCDGWVYENGEYYTYSTASCLYDAATDNAHAPIVGYAFDGYPIYGGLGFANADGTGGVVRMRSSYQLRNISERHTLPDGSELPESLWGPEVNNYFPLGRFVEDYVYTAGSGDLDEHNGRFCVTPEYPNGTYAYFVTVDAAFNPAFPYVIGDSFYGKVTDGNIGEFAGHNQIDAAATTYASVGVSGIIDIMLYPNPATDYFHVYILPGYENNIAARLIDMSGNVVFQELNWQPGVNYPIDVRSMNSGMYILQLVSGNASVTHRCIVRN